MDILLNKKVTITTLWTTEFGYSYNDDILIFKGEDESNYFFLHNGYHSSYLEKTDKTIEVSKNIVKTIELAEDFFHEIPPSYTDYEKIKISNSKLSRDESFVDEVLYLVAQNKTHFQFIVPLHNYLCISRKDDKNIIPVKIRLEEYKRGEPNPFYSYPQLKNIWDKRNENAVSSIDRFNNKKTSGKIFLILEEDMPIGITGYYLTDEKNMAGLRWHGLIPSHRKKGYGKVSLELLYFELVLNEKETRSIQELVPSDRPELIHYWEGQGFYLSSEELKEYKEMAGIQCYRMIKHII